VGKKGEQTKMGIFYIFSRKEKYKMDKFPMYPFSSSFSFSGGRGGNRDFEGGGGSGKDENSTPLVSNETKEYLFCVLNQCYENQARLYSNIWNAFVVVMLLVVVGGLLYMCYSIRISPEQQKKRRIKTQKLVLAKMREMKEMNQYTQPNGITFLPVYQNKGY
jgi:hypothetical protein